MAQLAIKGHPTRGSEVIALLEMLGGKNIYKLMGTREIWYILSGSRIEHSEYLFEEKGFTLEEFLEEFPYKIGDKVTLDKIPCTIKGMSWDCDDVLYYVQGIDFSKGVYSKDKDLQPYKEETIEKKVYNPITLIPVLDKVMIIPTDKESEIVQENNKFYLVKKQPQYPKTYEECCEVLFPATIELGKVSAHGYNDKLLEKFGELLTCRDAYWKTAGEQMGLGKPWKPDWNEQTPKYTIVVLANELVKTLRFNTKFILAFPTEEMRDAFYKNFKKLIETCKELL